jgi:hypothetical protein
MDWIDLTQDSDQWRALVNTVRNHRVLRRTQLHGICYALTYTRIYERGYVKRIVGSGAMLQAGRSRVRLPMRSMDSTIDLMFPAALRPWARLSP